MIENEETQEEEQKELTEAEQITEGQTAQELFNEKFEELFTEKEAEVEEEKEEQSSTEDSETEEVEDGDETPEGEETHEEEEETEPIPQDQVDIARSLGFKDDDIVKMANDSPERLEKMVELYSKPAPLPKTEEKVERQKEEIKETPQLKHLKLDDLGDLDPDTAKAVSAILQAHNESIDSRNDLVKELDGLKKHNETTAQGEIRNENERVDRYFDSVMDDVPELGTSNSLTDEQKNTRLEVYGLAAVLRQSRNLGESAALEEATYLYSLSKMDLETLEKEAEQRVKEKITKQKKRMSPRPSGKKTKDKEEKGDKAALETLTEGMRELGL